MAAFNFNFLNFYLFLLCQTSRERKRNRKGNPPFLDSVSNCPTQARLGQAKASSPLPDPDVSCGSKDTKAWAVNCCLPHGTLAKSWNQKWSLISNPGIPGRVRHPKHCPSHCTKCLPLVKHKKEKKKSKNVGKLCWAKQSWVPILLCYIGKLA